MIGAVLKKKYRVIKLIGTGGMSEVYLATNLVTRTNVAVKILKDECRENPEYLRRFEREGKTVLHLTQENIVHALEVGTYNDIPFIILEYVPGQTLKELLEQTGSLPQETAVNYCMQILNALSAAHESGIIHRDVKPQNVIITPDGVAKLTDFGIAKDVQASTVTFAGSSVLGSAHYLSPEQAKGQPVTEESDIYSTGIMLYEMLTGSVPFDGDSSVSIALKQINETPLPPIELNPDIFPSVNEAVLCALQKDPSLRFRSAEQMCRALKRSIKERNYHPTLQNLESESQEEDVLSEQKKATIIGNQNGNRLHISWKIAIVIGVFLMAFVGMFFGIRAIYSESIARAIVPSLKGKSLADATSRAQDYGFEIVVSEFEVSNEVDYGNVIEQSPEAGQYVKNGSTITVTVSAGPETPSVPNLIGKTYDEAVAALQSAGFTLGKVSYQVSDTAVGFVCSQVPSAGTESPEGGIVNICISATNATTSTMPSLLLKPVEDAVAIMEDLGEHRILITYDPSADPSTIDYIVMQQPLEGSTLIADMMVVLTVGGEQQYDYTSDVAYTLDIEENGVPVVITITDDINGTPVERILYSSTLEKGEKIPISVTATSKTDGIFELILYINNKEVSRKDIAFADKG